MIFKLYWKVLAVYFFAKIVIFAPIFEGKADVTRIDILYN